MTENMSKEEDWKELEEWQDKQNEIKQKNNVKEFKAKEYRGTEIFTKLISKLLYLNTQNSITSAVHT